MGQLVLLTILNAKFKNVLLLSKYVNAMVKKLEQLLSIKKNYVKIFELQNFDVLHCLLYCCRCMQNINK